MSQFSVLEPPPSHRSTKPKNNEACHIKRIIPIAPIAESHHRECIIQNGNGRQCENTDREDNKAQMDWIASGSDNWMMISSIQDPICTDLQRQNIQPKFSYEEKTPPMRETTLLGIITSPRNTTMSGGVIVSWNISYRLFNSNELIFNTMTQGKVVEYIKGEINPQHRWTNGEIHSVKI